MNNNNTFQEFDDKLMYMCTQTRFYDEDDESSINGGELIQVIQHLEPEQYKYEFPTKMCLKELAYLDDLEENYSYFDESSFSSTALSSVTQQQTLEYNMINHMNDSVWHETLIEEEEEEEQLVEDGKLSPLQLPAQVSRPPLSPTESISQSEDQRRRPVGPSSFLSDNMYKHVTQPQYLQKDYSFSRDYSNSSIPIMDTDNDSSTTGSSVRSSESRNIIIKLSKLKKTSSYIHSSSLTYISNDEGYDDNEDDELESHCVFYPLVESEDNEEYIDCKRDSAAIKIQALWRGYQCRRKNKQSFLRADQRAIANLAQFYGRLQRRQINTFNERLAQLEQRVREETAMRMAFEKAMEDMTVLIDQQQKILYDRLEQEVHMRQLYESKMNSALKQVQPLESRLKKEVVARTKMEEMMTRVLDQMHESETQRQKQTKEDAESRKRMELKLEQALTEIATIKKTTATTTASTTTRQPRISSIQQQQQQQKTVSNKTTSINLIKSNTSSTTTASLKKESTTINSSKAASIRRSIVPSNTALRRQQPTLPLYERPSVIPSNRRPPMSSTNRIPNNSTAPTPRRPLLTRK